MSETGGAENELPKREPMFTKGAWTRFIILAICLGGPYLLRDQIFGALETVSDHLELPFIKPKGPPTCGTPEAIEAVKSLIFQSTDIGTGDVLIGFRRPVGMSDLADAEVRPSDKKSAEIRASKIFVDASVLKAMLALRIDAVRPRLIERTTSKSYCLADVTATFSAANVPSNLPATFYVFNFMTGSQLVSSSEALRAKASSVRWNNPLSYSVQRTESGELYVTLE